MTKVVALCGFLGVGKTTTLQHVLTRCPEVVRVGVVANDVAKVNIDAQLVKSAAEDSAGNLVSVQLENGCACCTASDDLVESIRSLAAGREEGFDYIIVEASGVAEAGQMREVLTRLPADLVGETSPPCVVTVVDAFDFLDQYRSADMLRDRPDLVGAEVTADARRSVVDLLMEQVENADLVILNKVDRLDGEPTAKLEGLRAIVSGLAPPGAHVGASRFGAVDLLELVDATGRERHPDSCKHEHEHAHVHAHEHEHAHEHAHEDGVCKHANAECACEDNGGRGTDHKSKFGVESFVFSSARAFHGPTLAKTVLQRIAALQRAEDVALDRVFKHDGADIVDEDERKADAAASNPFRRVIRAKGFIWINRQPSAKLYWSLAGKSFAVTPAGSWDDDSPCPQDEKVGEDGKVGEDEKEGGAHDRRRQELVFIGVDLAEDRQRILDLLEAALVPSA